MSIELIVTSYGIKSEFRDLNNIQKISFVRLNSPFYKGEKWAIRQGGNCLNKHSQWVWEPIPSNRNQKFYKQFRFNSLREAVQIYEKYLIKTEKEGGE